MDQRKLREQLIRLSRQGAWMKYLIAEVALLGYSKRWLPNRKSSGTNVLSQNV